MSLWKYKYTAYARKELDKLDPPIKNRVDDYLKDICMLSDPTVRGKGLSGSRAGQWRYRVGDYRIICEIQGDVFLILVLGVGHRKRVYNH